LGKTYETLQLVGNVEKHKGAVYEDFVIFKKMEGKTHSPPFSSSWDNPYSKAFSKAESRTHGSFPSAQDLLFRELGKAGTGDTHRLGII